MRNLKRQRLKRRSEATDPLLTHLGSTTGSERVFRFFELLKHTKGAQAGQPFRLLDFQRDIVRDIYDRLTPDGTRRIREALLMMARKNGKTGLVAGLALYHLFADGEMRGEVIAAANSRDQASLLFDEAASMVRTSSILAERSVLSRARKSIICKVTGSTLRAIAADANRAHGLNCSAWVFDELHAAKNSELLDALRTSTGARRQPLGIVISTAGHDLLSPLGTLYSHAKAVAAKPEIDPAFYSKIFEAQPDDDWTAEETWRKANPAVGEFRSLDELRDSCERAKLVPAQQDAFKRLYLNMWTQSEHTWLDMRAWDACVADVPDNKLEGRDCYAGLDLSATTDLTALVLLFLLEDGRLAVRNFNWIPDEGILERERRDNVPFRRWQKHGLTLQPGNVIDTVAVTDELVKLGERFRIRQIGFDKWGATDVSLRLTELGFTVVECPQTIAFLAAPTKRLEELVLNCRLAHDGSPLLRWQAACTSVKPDVNGNIRPVKPDRRKHAKRIDSIVALIMAIDGWMRATPEVDLTAFLSSEPIAV